MTDYSSTHPRDVARSLVDGLLAPLFAPLQRAPIAPEPDDPTFNTGSCTNCGALYLEYEFSLDPIGRLVLDGHRCDPARVYAFHKKHERYMQQLTEDKPCARCRKMYEGLPSSVYCIPCGYLVRADADKARHSHGIPASRLCCDCPNAAPPGRKRCAQCAQIARRKQCKASRLRLVAKRQAALNASPPQLPLTL